MQFTWAVGAGESAGASGRFVVSAGEPTPAPGPETWGASCSGRIPGDSGVTQKPPGRPGSGLGSEVV